MILSEIVKVNKIESFDNIYIENELIKSGKIPVRWAIVDVDDNYIMVCVSYLNN